MSYSTEFEGSNKVFKIPGKMLLMKAIVQENLTSFWFEDISEFRTMSTKEFYMKVEREGWIQIN